MLGEERHDTLERIHLSYCENITIPAIHYLLQKLTKLTHLSLTGIPAFRHPELQKFCRPPPREFNSTQRAAFCVYSNSGVRDLRRYLEKMMAPIHDNADGYDIEEDDRRGFPSPAGYVRDVSEDYTGTGPLITDVSRRTIDERSSGQSYRYLPGGVVVPSAIDNGTLVQGNSIAALDSTVTTPSSPWWPRESPETVRSAPAFFPAAGIRRASHGSTRTVTALNHNGHGYPPSNGQLQTLAHSLNQSNATLRATRPASSEGVNENGIRHQAVPAVPVQHNNPGQERAQSPNSVRSSQSNGIAFLNSYDPVAMRREAERTAQNGTATPDLVFAELGHGRQLPIDEGEQDSDWVLQERPDTPVVSGNGTTLSLGEQDRRHGDQSVNRRRPRAIDTNGIPSSSSHTLRRESSSRHGHGSSVLLAGRLRSPSSPAFTYIGDDPETSLESSLNGLSLEGGRQSWREIASSNGSSAVASLNSSTSSSDSRNRLRFGGLRAALGIAGSGRSTLPNGNGSAQGFTNTTFGTGNGRR